MIEPTKVTQIERLLAAGEHSRSQIARMVGVSRPTLLAIAKKSRRCRPTVGEDQEQPPPAVRCPGCGGLVFPPCQLCRVRAVLERQKRRRSWLLVSRAKNRHNDGGSGAQQTRRTL
jgi:hypothetical protein